MTSKSAPLSNSTGIEKQAALPQDDSALADDDVLQERYYLEMFYRVLSQEDHYAKVQFQLQFGETVLRWIRLYLKREVACQCKQEEYYVAQTFACFWQIASLYKEKEFSTLAIVLQCLYASLNSVIIDTRRAYVCSNTFISIHFNNSDEVWNIVQSLLADLRQQRIAYLLFHCGLKPREIVQSYPEEFSDVLEISHIRYKILMGVLSNNA